MHLEQACKFIILVALQANSVAASRVDPAQPARRVFKINGVEFTPANTDCLVRIWKGEKTMHATFAPPNWEFTWWLDGLPIVVGFKRDCSTIVGLVPSPWRVKGDRVSDLPDDFSIDLAKGREPTTVTGKKTPPLSPHICRCNFHDVNII
ncbi:hypothetical protein PpBr36_08184 [Pyricularia pennisetigena]|uniref:hypothetical protein n=1 Tax=Pyricularia pennisetigena TaxID=1578925 RepID=UPI0011522FE2|nr:hypothetical protein PpBr36_08184 [Pyricularia pennisetigena]TLS24483.1 hypothetical protein PpBr36_08184 [Pyricularia pennisetigena]